MSTAAADGSGQGHWTRMSWVVGAGVALVVGPLGIPSAALSTDRLRPDGQVDGPPGHNHP